MFSDDLTEGKEYEEKIANHFRQFFDVVQSEGLDKDRDLTLTGSIEVKYDRLATDTGHFAIEMLYKGQQSGLCTSKSTAWALCTKEGCWLVGIKDLKNWVKLYCFDDKWHLTEAGDNKDSKVALIPYSAVKTMYKLI